MEKENANKVRKKTEYFEEQNDQIDYFKKELNECKIRLEELEKDTDLLQNLYRGGYLDIDGNPVYKGS